MKPKEGSSFFACSCICIDSTIQLRLQAKEDELASCPRNREIVCKEEKGAQNGGQAVEERRRIRRKKKEDGKEAGRKNRVMVELTLINVVLTVKAG